MKISPNEISDPSKAYVVIKFQLCASHACAALAFTVGHDPPPLAGETGTDNFIEAGKKAGESEQSHLSGVKSFDAVHVTVLCTATGSQECWALYGMAGSSL